ncbi:UNVERIFIED_CONTAM: hypothetical protein PYX00_000427 [Menopon gallinae]|uniref:Uncharacterized protein n=1 Tax=Menopon gallinae TaxID=328185 RepID=A0AAW2I9Y2_9NEOP
MVCDFEVEDDSSRRCVCDRFHEWRPDLNECYPHFNVTEFLENLGDGNDMGKHLEREAERVFLGLVIVGLTIVSLLMSFIAICSVYGCCCTDKARYRR